MKMLVEVVCPLFCRINSLGIGAVASIHKKWSFSTSKALLGTLGPVSRARVCELVNHDPDRPLGAPQRVAGAFITLQLMLL